jgi:hypothetical protein
VQERVAVRKRLVTVAERPESALVDEGKPAGAINPRPQIIRRDDQG